VADIRMVTVGGVISHLGTSRSGGRHGIWRKICRQAIDAAHVLQAPVLSQVIDPLRRPVADEVRTIFSIIEEGDAHAARGLDEIDGKADDLARTGYFIEMR
jgi:hypothetical protein